jgi:hypothetical protein
MKLKITRDRLSTRQHGDREKSKELLFLDCNSLVPESKHASLPQVPYLHAPATYPSENLSVSCRISSIALSPNWSLLQNRVYQRTIHLLLKVLLVGKECSCV